MKLRKQTFKHLPIHKQFLFITGIFLFIIATFAVMIFHSMQKDLITNANTQAEISTQKSLNELEVLCLKLDVLCSQIQSDSVYKELLLASSYQSISPQTVSDINSNISYIKCLNTDIADIAFANDLIRSLALSHQVPEIASIAVAMGKMYRYNTKGAPIVPFAEELEMTKAYIEIQKYRFQDKFDIIYNIPEDILSVPVIKIILQPIVENSIQHGIEPSLNKCMLYIGCTILGNDLIIEIRDDGVGMEPEKLQEMQTLLLNKNYDSTKYVGIANTNARLKLQYGNDYGISIHSEENDGTVVTIRMPITTQSES